MTDPITGNSGYDFGVSLCESIKVDGTGEPLIELVGTGDMTLGQDWSGANSKTFILDATTITLDINCADAAAATAHIIDKINDSALDVNNYYISDDGQFISIGYAEFTIANGTGAGAQIGWDDGTYLYNIIYLMAKRVEPGVTFDPGINSFPNGLSYDLNLGERTVGIRITDISLEPYDTRTMTDMYNYLSDFIYSHTQANAARIYCHVRNLNDDTYMYLSYINQSDTNVPFIQGRFVGFAPLAENGVITIKSISIGESWMSLSLT